MTKQIAQKNSQNTLILFVFDKDTLAKCRWSEIVSGYKVAKRYDLSLDYLRSINWTINFP
ncbi:MAG: hypothetical protein A2X08_16680 [Bacteroidetes bacterium GWA2_32_17]|nr:MAG: hypothetical protein A2X08_16680 [Bacteroidetes bacterium GWA2_32_17]